MNKNYFQILFQPDFAIELGHFLKSEQKQKKKLVATYEQQNESTNVHVKM